jgi:hypothetical protein
MTTPSRQELEREVASLRDRMQFVMEAMTVARNLVVAWVPEDTRKSSEYKRLLGLVTAVVKEGPMAAPALARLGWQQGMKEAKDVLASTATLGDDAEWKAALKRAAEEIDRKLTLR